MHDCLGGICPPHLLCSILKASFLSCNNNPMFSITNKRLIFCWLEFQMASLFKTEAYVRLCDWGPDWGQVSHQFRVWQNVTTVMSLLVTGLLVWMHCTRSWASTAFARKIHAFENHAGKRTDFCSKGKQGVIWPNSVIWFFFNVCWSAGKSFCKTKTWQKKSSIAKYFLFFWNNMMHT